MNKTKIICELIKRAASIQKKMNVESIDFSKLFIVDNIENLKDAFETYANIYEIDANELLNDHEYITEVIAINQVLSEIDRNEHEKAEDMNDIMTVVEEYQQQLELVF